MSQRLGSRTATEDDSPEHEPDDDMSSGERATASHELPSVLRSTITGHADSPEHEADD